MPFTETAKIDAHALFNDRRPSPDGLIEEDVIGFVSAIAFRPMEDGEMVMRLTDESGDVIDLRTNPVCAGRFAVALLALINQNGWFDVDLRVSDRGHEIARIEPASRTTLKCEAIDE
jgi:hypothetical protein